MEVVAMITTINPAPMRTQSVLLRHERENRRHNRRYRQEEEKAADGHVESHPDDDDAKLDLVA